MPTYDYQCEKCGRFEIYQSIKDDALTVCPTCGSKVERLISQNIGFVLKGSGFYQNDYKKPSKDTETAPKTPPPSGCGGCKSAETCPVKKDK